MAKNNRNSLKSKVYSLPKTIQEELNERLLNKEFTLKELKDFINKHPDNQGVEVSQSGLNRYAKAFDKEMQDLKSIQELFAKLPKEIDFSKESSIHQVTAQVLVKSIWEKVAGKEEIDSKDLLLLSRALKDVMTSIKDREKIRADLRKELKEEIERETLQKLDKAIKNSGLSKKTLSVIREALKD